MRELLIWISITLCSTTHLLPPLASWRISIHTPKCYTDYEPSIMQLSKDKITQFLFLNDIFYFCGTFNVLTFYDSDGSELIPIQFLSGGNVLIPNLNFFFFPRCLFPQNEEKMPQNRCTSSNLINQRFSYSLAKNSLQSTLFSVFSIQFFLRI